MHSVWLAGIQASAGTAPISTKPTGDALGIGSTSVWVFALLALVIVLGLAFLRWENDRR